MRRTYPLCLFTFLSLLANACRPAASPTPPGFIGVEQRVADLLADPAHCPTGSQEDVQRLISDPGPDGWSRIPAGCYLIETSLVLPAGARVAGAGMDTTILYRDPDQFAGLGHPIIVSYGPSRDTQITGLALVGVRRTEDTGEDYGIQFARPTDFRVDHCYFTGFGSAGLRVDGPSSGVIDHNLFADNYKAGINNLGYGVVVYGDDRWPADTQPGSAEALFVEDNMFTGNRHAIAAGGGAHYIFRHNLVQGNVVAHAVDAHGPGYGWSHGTRMVEIYDNIIETPQHNEAAIAIRGGDGVVFGNTIRGYQTPILLVVEWGTPDSQKDSYPAKDQIRDLWIWDNDAGRVVIDQTAQGFVEIGRDLFLEPMPAYTPYTYPHPLATGGPYDATQ